MSIDIIDNRDDLTKTAVFAGGCFWCISAAFNNLDGILEVISGYTGGAVTNPSYTQVCSGNTGHYEAVMIKYDPLRISYIKLLEIFFAQIDPTDENGQFADRGSQYKTAVFYTESEQKKAAASFIEVLNSLNIYDSAIVTEIKKEKPFYEAEEYHQDYAVKNTYDYEAYAKASGRKAYINSIWKGIDSISQYINKEKYHKPSDHELKKMLTPLQYGVTQAQGTEPPFDNQYYYFDKEGIYVDVVTKEPLFSSSDKYESGSGWPSFNKPMAPENLIYLKDNSLGEKRIEVRSKYGNTHLGHVFPDGPLKTGLRYCMNSSSLLFIPKAELDNKGYPQYKYIFS